MPSSIHHYLSIYTSAHNNCITCNKSLQSHHLLLSFRQVSVFEPDHNSDLVRVSTLSAEIIVPSIHKLTFVYIDDRAVIFRVLEVKPFIVHADRYHIVPSVVVLLVGTWVGGGLEDLDQDDHWLAKEKVLL